LETGEELFRIETNAGASASDFVPSEGLLVRALSNRGIVVWDIHSKQELYSPLTVCEGYCVNSLKLSPDGTRMAVAATAERDQLSVWDLKTGEPLFITEAPGNYAGTAFAWSPDNQSFAAAFDNGTILVWDAERGSQVRVLSVDAIEGLAWSMDGNSLITLSQYESLAVWDVKTGQKSRSLNEHTSWVMDLVWSPDGSMLAQGAEDGEIILWEARSGKQLRSFHDPAGWVNNLAWSPDGKEIAESGGQNAIKIWDIQTGQQVRTWDVKSLTVVDLAWSPDASMLASISYEGGTTLWDASTGEPLRSLGSNYGSADLSWSPQGDRLSTSYPYPDFEGEQVTLWDPHTGELVLTKQGIHDIAWSPLGDTVASISDNGTGLGKDDTTLVLWDPQTGKEIRNFNTGTFLTHIAWSPDGKLLVVSGAQEADHALMVLDAQTGKQLHVLQGHYNVPSAIAWSPRGDFIASSSADGTVIIWRIVPSS
jgi:WD40 repeat protein